MLYVSEIQTTPPQEYRTELQRKVYATLAQLGIPYERVDTGDAITMEDCRRIDEKLDMRTVKTLFLCNRQKTTFYLYITTADKPFVTKDFSAVMNIPRQSFATEDLLQEKLGVKIGAATIYGVLLDTHNEVTVVIDKDVLKEEWYGCSDGTTTGYMKVRTKSIVSDFLNYAGHQPVLIEI